MFTTCLFVIVTSITTDTTSNEQSNNTGTNNYPLFNRRILNLFIFLSIIFRIVNLVTIKFVHFNPSILNLRAVHASRNLPNPTAYFHTRFINPSSRKIFLMSCGEIGTVWWVEGGCGRFLGPRLGVSKWSGKDKLDFLLRILKRIAARIPLETCSPGWNACAPYCNRALCT